MGRTKYKLQSVLNVRNEAKQAVARRLADARACLAEEEARLAACRASLLGCRDAQTAAAHRMIRRMEQGTDAKEIVLHRRHLQDLKQTEQELAAAVERQRVCVAASEDVVERTLVELIEAAKEVRIIEKHYEVWQRQESTAENQREQKANAEVGLVIHTRGSRL